MKSTKKTKTHTPNPLYNKSYDKIWKAVFNTPNPKPKKKRIRGL